MVTKKKKSRVKKLSKLQALQFIRKNFGKLDCSGLMRRCFCDECGGRNFTDVQDDDIESLEDVQQFVNDHEDFEIW